MATRQLTAVELGLSAKDMKVTTTYSSPILDVAKAFTFTAVIDVVETGTQTVGEAKITVNAMSDGGASATVLYGLDILTGIDVQTDLDQNVLTYGAGVTALNIGSASLSANADIFKVVEFMRIDLKATTAADGTTSSASVLLLIDE